jgi:hypothetical protein
MDHGPVRRSPAEGHQDGIEDELSMNRRPDRPPDDLAREEIHNDGDQPSSGAVRDTNASNLRPQLKAKP